MKVKVLKTFVSGRYSAAAGEVLDLPDAKAEYLIRKTIVEKQTPKKTAAKKAAN